MQFNQFFLSWDIYALWHTYCFQCFFFFGEFLHHNNNNKNYVQIVQRVLLDFFAKVAILRKNTLKSAHLEAEVMEVI
jgi:surface polysaccharide O-acyltransferase-like enzyme